MKKLKSIALSFILGLLLATQAWAVDHNIYINDIKNRNSTYSVAHVTTSGTTVATATLTSDSSFVNQSGANGSVFAAYKDLAERLNGGVLLVPLSTTTQRDALTNTEIGTLIYNITTDNLQFFDSASAWVSSAGATISNVSTYGAMFENKSNGSSMDTTNKTWITATGGVVDSGTIVTFSDNSTGDRLVVGTGGAGDYLISFATSFTNAGGNTTTATIYINGVASTISDSSEGDSSKHRNLVSSGILTLAVADYVTLHIVSSTSSDVVKVYQCHVNITNES